MDISYEIVSYIPTCKMLKLCTSDSEIHILILRNKYYRKIHLYSINYHNPDNL